MIEPLDDAGLRTVLPALLQPPDGPPISNPLAINNFLAYISVPGIEWDGVSAGPARGSHGVVVSLRLPGRTALLLLSAPDDPTHADPDHQAALSAALLRLAPYPLHYAQVLLEPQAVGKRRLLERAGFRQIARLLYQDRAATYPWCDPPSPRAAEWLGYHEREHKSFAETILATYQDSLDCAELLGLRPMDDVIESHRAAGPFDPALWELALVDGAPAGCLLMSRVAGVDLVEIVYTGVIPAFRGRGIGAILLQRALAHARRIGRRRVTVVVDEVNAPARRLYARFAFELIGTRDVYVLPMRARGS